MSITADIKQKKRKPSSEWKRRKNSVPLTERGAVCGTDHTIARRCGLRPELAPKGAAVETFELDGIPPFNQDEEQNPPAKVTELKRRLREANAILFVTPEYN